MVHKSEAPGTLAGVAEGVGGLSERYFTPLFLYNSSAAGRRPDPAAFPILTTHWPGFADGFEGAER